MKLLSLLEATISFKDPDHDPEVIKALGDAEDRGRATEKIATPKWEALATKLNAKNPVIQYKGKWTNLSVLSIAVGPNYYFTTNSHGGVVIACNKASLKFTEEEKSFIKSTMENAGKKVYGMDIGSTEFALGYYNNMAEPKWEHAIKLIAAHFRSKYSV